MDIVATLLAEITKTQDDLNRIDFKLNDEQFTFYFTYLTLLQKVKIEQLATVPHTTIKTDGSQTTKFEKQDYMIPIYTILVKAKDENGKDIFNANDPLHKKLISDFPASLSSYVAYELSKDIFGSLGIGEENE